MQMHFLRNMAGVSIAALVFSSIGMKILADQLPVAPAEEIKPKIKVSEEGPSLEGNIPNMKEEAPLEMNPSEDAVESPQTKPNVMLSEEERDIVKNLLKEEADAERLSEEKKVENLESAILDTPEKRSAARVNTFSDGEDDSTEWRYEGDPDDLSIFEGQEALPSMEGELEQPKPPEGANENVVPAESEEESVAIEENTPSEAALPQQPNTEEETLPPSMPEQPEAPTVAPQEEAPSDTQAEQPVTLKNDKLSDRIVSLSPVATKAVIIRPKVGATPIIYGGDDDDPAPQKEEDPDDPTSKGTRKGGQHKGIEVAPMIKAIPIIRMGEYNKENAGLTVIKPWNS